MPTAPVSHDQRKHSDAVRPDIKHHVFFPDDLKTIIRKHTRM